MKTYIYLFTIILFSHHLKAQEVSVYDFENLNINAVVNQDNWQVLGCHTNESGQNQPPTIETSANQGNYVGSKALKITSYDVGSEHSNCDRLNDDNWKIPTITDSTHILIVDVEMSGGYWGREFSLCYDKNEDGNFTASCNQTDQDEKGITIIKTLNKVEIRTNGIAIGEDNLISEWAKYRMVIDLQANNRQGEISVYAQFLENNVWTPFANLQNLNANFNFDADNGSNPKKLNGMKLENEAGLTAQFDNIIMRTFQKTEDYIICDDGQEFNILVTKDIPDAQFEWHDGSTNNSISISDTGTFFVKININDHIVLIDTFEVMYDNYIVNLGEDIILCPEETIEIGVESDSLASYNWNTNQTTNKINVSQEGEFILELDNTICTYYDTIVVSDFVYPLDLGSDTIICNNSFIEIGPINDSSVSYKWNDGSTGNTINISNSGRYTLEVTKGECSVFDTINILKHNSIKLNNDTLLCNNDTYTISVSSDYETFDWSNGSSQYQTTIDSPGRYWVQAQKDGCTINSDTISIFYDYSPDFITKFEDVTICNRRQHQLTVNANNYDRILWYDNSTGITNTIFSEGFYWVELSNQCGTSIDEVEISTENCDCYAFIPEAFSPNSDGINDDLEVKVGCVPTRFELAIYNRWGAIVFETTDYKEKWDGKFKGSVCPDGMYAIRLDVKFERELKSTFTRKLTILR